jgi:hypothetical protein
MEHRDGTIGDFMPIIPALLFWMAPSPLVTTFEEINFQTGERRQFPLSYRPVAHVVGRSGAMPTEVLQLPGTGPHPSYRNSGFSTIFRARDVLDIDRYPARAVAKIYRLNADGSRASQACTAQFVGPRHLITAGHCIADPVTGIPHAGFEVAVRYDAGEAKGGTARVSRAWLAADQMRLSKPEDALVTPERCSDLATLQIREPLGADVGWLGMRDAAQQQASLRTTIFHRFAYPHVSTSENIEKSAANAPPEAQAELKAQIAAARRTEPDFSPENMYYEFGRLDEAEGLYMAYRTPYSAPGRSGSALIDGTGAIVALASRGYLGTFYSCRLTAADIGAIGALIGREAR